MLVATWVVLAGGPSAHELALGALLASGAVWMNRRVFGRQLEALARHPRWLVQVARFPWYAVTGTGEILAVLARQLARRRPAASLLLSVPFEVGRDPDDEVRRALAVAFTSATPNFLVLGVDRARGRLVYHQVARSPVPRMTERLGARP